LRLIPSLEESLNLSKLPGSLRPLNFLQKGVFEFHGGGPVLTLLSTSHLCELLLNQPNGRTSDEREILALYWDNFTNAIAAQTIGFSC
jgi:hypothetical protein